MNENKKNTLYRLTKSVCPKCLRTLDAAILGDGDSVVLQKTCPEHGAFRDTVWIGPGYEAWGSQRPVSPEPKDHYCPQCQGLCEKHVQETCCVLLEVTTGCNIRCPVCYAGAGENRTDLSLEEIRFRLNKLKESGTEYNLQLSGGEPTIREDLDEIIKMGKAMGFDFFQLNTNGIRIGQDPDYLKKLKDGGLDCVYLQFDGLSEKTNQLIRGKDYLNVKKAAVENCKKIGLGVVLVPTVVKGINEQEMGDIIDFALENQPVIRGIHFQPASFFGRFDEKLPQEHLTIPEVLSLIQRQTQGRITAEDFSGGSAENPYCSFHGSFLIQEDGRIKALKVQPSCCGSSKSSRNVVARHWRLPSAKTVKKPVPVQKTGLNVTGFEDFLTRMDNNKLTISGMLFQDARTLDAARLRQCYIHVLGKDGVRIPFCAHNITSEKGTRLYRPR